MRPLTLRAICFGFCAIVAGCATPRSLPPYETPVARTQFQRVRTTAYTDTESDHIQYSNHNALGGTLQSNVIHSAAADWSRWPAGTVFRIVETGELYRVDDYGWALAGTNTIDLYKPSRDLMNAWGVRRVTIENLQWGDPAKSLAVLRERTGYRHVERMVSELHERYAELKRPVPTSSAPVEFASVQPTAAPLSVPPPRAIPVNQTAAPGYVQSYPSSATGAPSAPVAQPVYNNSTSGGFHAPSNVNRDPFFANSGN